MIIRAPRRPTRATALLFVAGLTACAILSAGSIASAAPAPPAPALPAPAVPTPALPAPALPAPAVPTPALPAPVASGPTITFPMGSPTFYQPEFETPDYVGNDTSRFRIEPQQTTTGPVTCRYDYLFGDTADTVFTAAQWNSGSVLMTVPDGDVVPYYFGVHYGMSCSPGDDAWQADWELHPVSIAGESVTLHEGETDGRSVYAGYGGGGGSPVAAHPGDLLTVVGAPGTWPVPAEVDASAQYVRFENGGFLDEAVVTSDFSVSPDGSTVTVTVPPLSAFSALDLAYPVGFGIYLGGDLAGGAARNDLTTSFYAPVEITRGVDSVTDLTLSTPYSLSFLRVTATAIVRVEGMPRVSGVVTFAVDGNTVGRVVLTPSNRGKATVRLPYLSRGKHSVTATYSGSDAVAPSAGPPTPVRIFF